MSFQMNEQSSIQANGSFKEFLIKNKRNRISLILAAIAIVIQFGVFKYFYPFANFIHGDSFSYLDAAYHNLSINTYLIGYSNFLRFISVFTKSDFILTGFQYLLIQGSILILLFTIFYFYSPGKVIQVILLCFMVLNPLFLHLGNLVSSDGYFLSLSLLWLTLLLWIIHQPSKRVIIGYVLILFLAFTTRYNAMIYPVISAGAFCLSKLSIRQKLISIFSTLIICGLFVGFTTYKYKKLTGYRQYSPFSGWQWANNAMYAYRYVDISERKLVPKKFRVLDNMIREYFDSTKNLKKYPVEGYLASTFYMWSKGMPLMKYRDNLFKKDTTVTELKKWASMGPLYKAYGIYIIKQYPMHFARYFIWPNANKYYSPPLEFLESYNSSKDSVLFVAQAWFSYKSAKIASRMKDKKVWILNFYPIFSGTINFVMLCSLLCYLILKGWAFNNKFNKVIILAGTIWLLNAGFTILASSAALRFQSFPIILASIIVAILLDWMVQLIARIKNETVNSINKDPKMNKRVSSESIA
jgi:hypothetical protein